MVVVDITGASSQAEEMAVAEVAAGEVDATAVEEVVVVEEEVAKCSQLVFCRFVSVIPSSSCSVIRILRYEMHISDCASDVASYDSRVRLLQSHAS